MPHPNNHDDFGSEPEREDIELASAAVRESWETEIGKFKDRIYPAFERHGISLGEAMIIFFVHDAVFPEDEDDE